MIDRENGLEEIFHVFDAFTSGGDPNIELDFSKGILQSIGYKEFHGYYRAQKQGVEEPTLEAAKECLCSRTVQYASYQMKWLSKRIVPIFKPDLDGKLNLLHQIILNDPSQYEEIALSQGQNFVTEMLNFYQSNPQFDLETYAEHFLEVKAQKFASWKKYNCDICSIEVNGQLQWEEHLKTRKHRNKKRNVAKQKAGGDPRQYYYQNNEGKKSVNGQA